MTYQRLSQEEFAGRPPIVWVAVVVSGVSAIATLGVTGLILSISWLILACIGGLVSGGVPPREQLPTGEPSGRTKTRPHRSLPLLRMKSRRRRASRANRGYRGYRGYRANPS
ncbi:MAG: hypothetical protein WD651_04605, partial [Acidimicrobiia bacterium]